jgi:hypothetical protein
MRRWTCLTLHREIAGTDRAQRLLTSCPMRTRSLVLAHVTVLAACSSSSDTDGPPTPDGGSDVEPVEDGCPALYAQEVMPDFYVDIDDSEWAALEYEFHHRQEALEAGQDPSPYHPAVFRYEDDVVEDAMIRLKGASSWDATIAMDDDPKMQFVISFNEYNEDGRYRGRRKLALDMPRIDWTFLRQRLALHALRSMGIPAQCANSARLFINGEYYGLYTNVERMDREILERLFPEAPDGDLWEGARIIKTNEDDYTWDRLNAFWDATDEGGTVADMDAVADVDQAIHEWAAEAVLPQADGYYMGRANFYLYDHPTRGFLYLPNDLDASFDWVAPDIDAMFPVCSGQWWEDRLHYLLVMDDPVWRDKYVDALREELDRYDPADMEKRLDEWSAQIAEAADADPHRPFSDDDHREAVGNLRGYFRERAGFLADWLSCRTSGGADSDGDGAEFCRDCDDQSPALAPTMPETCNAIDDDCDGHVDELADCPEPP